MTVSFIGAVAQLGEHLLCKEGVRSSSLLGSTFSGPCLAPLYGTVGIAVNSAVPAPDPTGPPAIAQIVPKSPLSGTRMTSSCARPNEWCTLTSEEEDKRELQFRRKT